MSHRSLLFPVFLVITLILAPHAPTARGESVARIWNEQNLEAIRLDFPNPAVHARNLFHTSVAMWDAWAVYDATAVGYVARDKIVLGDPSAARDEAISYAAYRVLHKRYSIAVDPVPTLDMLNAQMATLGYDIAITTTKGDTPAAVGNRIAAAVLAFTEFDGSNEDILYTDPLYEPVNDPLILLDPGTEMLDPNRWQPLAFDVALTQNGLVADEVQIFVGSHWGGVLPFALFAQSPNGVYYDPGLPPQLGGVGDADYKAGNVTVVNFSSLLDPTVTGLDDLIDISPGAKGNNTLGTNDGGGRPMNPVTGKYYAPNFVPHGDYGRVVAEFWADGPKSETPPGHWNTLANEKVADHRSFERRFEGTGPPLDELEWDVKVYFALNGAVHDSAVAAWGCKGRYDYVRPISSIRYMAGLGQSSDENGDFYHPNGIPLVSDLIELVTATTAAPKGRHAGLTPGKIALNVWGGEPEDPKTEFTGRQWIHAEDWLPYQRDTFVTPAFAGYISGHSTFSRAAAEVLTSITGSEYFPGGMGTFTAFKDEYLEFEQGPSVTVQLQWATYYDASDEAGISRLYGGIHVPVDDGPGRIVGSAVGKAAWQLARKYYDGTVVSEPIEFRIERAEAGYELAWSALPGFYYTVESSTDLVDFAPLEVDLLAQSTEMRLLIGDAFPRRYFRIVRTLTPTD